VLFIIVLAPVGWHFLQPYQRSRIMPFLSQTSDSGLSYNSIQSVISVGSGRLWGRGLGEGIQTQLAFLPERHTDFAFASISEELGFIGAFLVLFFLFILLWLISSLLGRVSTHSERIFVGGALASLFAQVFVHVGMNVGFLPVTGLPLPLVSVGGSSLVSTMILLGILLGIYERV
jgi:rod shape determining protein RodA